MAKKSFGKGVDAIFGAKEKKVVEKATVKKVNKGTSLLYKNCLMQIEHTQLEKFKAFAYWQRMQQKDLINKALEMFFSSIDRKQIDQAIKHYQDRDE